MAKKKQQGKAVETVAAEPVPDEEEEDEEEEEEELELLQVDLGDMVKLKQVLDEAVASVLLEKLDEDYRWDNFKLSIMALACIFAMVAQFAPIPFPESRPLLGVCGCAYFLLSGVLQFIATFIDKDSILLTKPLSPDTEAGKKTSTKNELLKKHGVRVRSNLPRFSEWYSVILEHRMDEKEAKSPFTEQKWSVGKFFDKEGFFDEFGLMKEVEGLYERFEKDKGHFD
ncbi:peptidase complex subunit 2 [Seminavis robusta]|uniref:Signal peptidase complex subunit 2 n=1 Tax=Seminavis robusta TaxID=568900 RepID=A0A9N8EX87_9STRA|nr:peptidase complex subunit 2 [Seminavis robusta]|eukprot:Sro1968_g308420.1 peptidase complex subunit 2 (227) ;mRNA; f:10271-11100